MEHRADHALLETMLQAQRTIDEPPPDIMTSSHSSTSQSPSSTRRPTFFIPGINGKARCCETPTQDSSKNNKLELSGSSLLELQMRASSSGEQQQERALSLRKKKKKKPSSSSHRRKKRSGEESHHRRHHHHHHSSEEERRSRREHSSSRRDNDGEDRRKSRHRRKRFHESRTQSIRSIDDLDVVDSREERRRKEILGVDGGIHQQQQQHETPLPQSPDLDIQDIGYQSEEVLGTLRQRRHDSLDSLGTLKMLHPESPTPKHHDDAESLTQNLHDSILRSLGCPRTPSSSIISRGTTPGGMMTSDSSSSRFSGDSIRSMGSLDESADILAVRRSPRSHKSMASLLHSSVHEQEHDSQSSLDLDEIADGMGPMERLYTSMIATEWNKHNHHNNNGSSSEGFLVEHLSQSAPAVVHTKASRHRRPSQLPPLPVLGDDKKKSRKSSSSKRSSTTSKRSKEPKGDRLHNEQRHASSSKQRRSSSRSKRHADEDLSTSNTTKTSSTSTATTGTVSKRSSSRRSSSII